ncbi:hypothetical protein AB0O20_26875 [Streptomyces kronopolitis]|uniref:hypothetical protein n=1 Tax=Streptomyces kronopolitis TaxID=1612435 RepID=UPI0034139668
MTQDDMLAAVAYLEAVWDSKRDATAILASRGEGEKPILDVVLDLAEHVAQLGTQQRLGIHEGLTAEQIEAAKKRLEEERETQLSILLVETLRTWSLTARGEARSQLCLAVIGFMAVIFKATDDEVPQMLAILRKGALAG